MRYIGGKGGLLVQIKEIIDAKCGSGNETFCDLFSGTGAVSRFFKPYYQIISNDMLYFSHVLTAATIENNRIPAFKRLKESGIDDPLTYLETAKIPASTNSYVSKTYSPAGDMGRMYFTKENARRIDFIREKIEKWRGEKLINTGEFKYLLACLIEGIPFISNITGTYGAFLKHWDKRTFKKIEMYRLQVVDNKKRNICYNDDANELIEKISGDILYIDPPYNDRQYLPNYHVLETIARYDFPEVKGVTGMRDYKSEKSDYCIRANVEKIFSNLIEAADFKHIVVSYSDDGLLQKDNIMEILKLYCDPETVSLNTVPYNRYKGKLDKKKHEHFEYIFYANKKKPDVTYSVQNKEYSSSIAEQIPERKRFIKSPMNYIGGKYRLLPQIFELIPQEINIFVDLFAGGFNVAANIKSKKTICNDMNYKVVEMVRLLFYADINMVLRRIDEKIKEYNLSKENEEGYRAFRDFYNSTGDPIDLFTLSCFSFNYQFRFNNQLEYNNPFGKNRSCFSETTKKNLKLFMDEIKKKDIVFYTKYFMEISIDGLGNEDFIYCDPPYLITNGSYNDGNRGFHDWGENEEKNLCLFLDKANEKKIKFALSNVLVHKNRENKILTDWAKKYYIHYIDTNYSNCNYHARNRETKTVEVLITNY